MTQLTEERNKLQDELSGVQQQLEQAHAARNAVESDKGQLEAQLRQAQQDLAAAKAAAAADQPKQPQPKPVKAQVEPAVAVPGAP